MENYIFIGASFLVVVLLFIFALFKFVLSNKPKDREYEIDFQSAFGMETVMMVLDSTQSSLEDLQQAMDKLFEDYDRISPSKQQIKNVLIALSLHKNAEKDIIMNTQEKFEERNPDLKHELERAVMKGLNARGVNNFKKRK